MESTIVLSLLIAAVGAGEKAEARLAVLPARLASNAVIAGQRLVDQHATEAARAALASVVMEPAAVGSILRAKGKDTLLDCLEPACAAEIAGALGVSTVLRVDVRKPRSHWIVAVFVVDAARQPPAARARAVEHAEGTVPELLATVRRLVGQVLTAKGAVPVAKAPSVSTADGALQPCARTTAEILEALRPYLGELNTCADAVRREETVAARVDLDYHIGDDGKMTEIKVTGAGAEDADLTACFATALAELRYAANAGGGCRVRLPVNLGGAVFDL